MTIAVASGKGGTGKTTIATALAMLWPEPVALLDADVEEPNCRFFLDTTEGKQREVFLPVPQIDEAICTGCGACSSFCRYGALVRIGRKVMAFPNLCHSCGACMMVCPKGAISEKPSFIGTIDSAQFRALDGGLRTHRWGTLKLGAAMAPPLIRELRREKNKEPLQLIDSPPGASCPMANAVKNADLVLMVAENTPFGAHDLEKAISTLEEMDLPVLALINRADLGGGEAEAVCRRKGIDIIGRVPFDRKVAESYARGVHPILEVPAFRQAVEQVVGHLIAFLQTCIEQKT